MRATAPPYNSGLAVRTSLAALRKSLPGVSYAATSRGVVFAHHVEHDYRPGEVAIITACAECIYCEVPWSSGWALFHERAGVTPIGTHAEYIAQVKRQIIDQFGKPTFIVCSKHDAAILGRLPMRPILLNGGRAWLAVSNVDEIPETADDTGQLLLQLAHRYRSVYDFGCGYGNALQCFGYFIGSDIDQKCLAYIARELLNGRHDRTRDGAGAGDPALPQERP